MSYRRRLRVRPMAGLRTDTQDPVHPPIAAASVQDEPGQLPLLLAFRLQQFHAEALRPNHRGAVRGKAGGVDLIDQGAGVPGVLGDGVDGPFEDLALLVRARHGPES